MTIDPKRLLQSVYVPMSDGTRLAVDVWLPVQRIARGERVGIAFRGTRYHRAKAAAGPEPEADSNHELGRLWTDAGFALILSDARGTGASFGTRAMELSPREIADYGEVIDWAAAHDWSNGRVGVFGTSYEGQAAELVAALGNPHVMALAALFSPLDPYRELFYPGGCATSGRFAGWMLGSRRLDGIAEQPPGAKPDLVKPVDGPEGAALLAAAIAEHQGNVDMLPLMRRAPFRDDSLPGLDWLATTPAAHQEAIQATGVPMLIRAGWLDGAFAAGAVRRFATFTNQQEVEIGPWGHGGRTFADTLLPNGALAGDRLLPEAQDRRLVEFFSRYVERAEPPDGRRALTFGTLGTDLWQTVEEWPPPGTAVRRWHLNPGGALAPEPAAAATVRQVVDPAASTGATNRWLAVDLSEGATYPGRKEADEALLAFTSEPLDADVHLVGAPVLTLRLATSGPDGAVYAYLEAVAPSGEVIYVTEGCLRFVHRGAGLEVPKSFARSDGREVMPGADLELAVELLPVAALLPAGHRVRVAVAGHDASCFERYGPPDETFTLGLGEASWLDLPVLP
ncbi:CocE/NonD family hydrolase [Flindersiella endophytica]